MADPELARRLAYVHQTLELIAFLLAVLLVLEGGLGTIVGGAGILLLIVNVLARVLGDADGGSAAS